MITTPMELDGIYQWLGYAIGVLLALVIQGEGQEFFVLMFQPISQRGKVSYDLDPLHHVDVKSIPLLIMAGWGWGKKRVVEPPYFPSSWILRALIPLSGAIANMLLVGILATIDMMLPLSMIQLLVRVNILMAVANLVVPLPPLALGRAVCSLFKGAQRYQVSMELFGAVILTVLVLLGYLIHRPFLQDWVLSLSTAVSKWVLHA